MVDYGQQILWPDHCVQGTVGAQFHDALQIPHAELVLRKGFRPMIDSYSALYENDRKTPTGLAGICASVVSGASLSPGSHWTSAYATRPRTRAERTLP
jgi:nicotinamidase-related amidase